MTSMEAADKRHGGIIIIVMLLFFSHTNARLCVDYSHYFFLRILTHPFIRIHLFPHLSTGSFQPFNLPGSARSSLISADIPVFTCALAFYLPVIK